MPDEDLQYVVAGKLRYPLVRMESWRELEIERVREKMGDMEILDLKKCSIKLSR